MAKFEVAPQIAEILDDYSDEVKAVAIKACNDVAADAVRELKNTSPRRSGGSDHYADGWAKKKLKDGAVVYNKTKPQLTHLLENGFYSVKKKARIDGQSHIKPVEEQEGAALTREVEKNLK